jgi:hypothetical protein
LLHAAVHISDEKSVDIYGVFLSQLFLPSFCMPISSEDENWAKVALSERKHILQLESLVLKD